MEIERPMLRVGDIIDRRYQITRIAGMGGFATVYQAEHLQLDRVVAIKHLEMSGEKQGNAARRFLQEARLMARFNHPNLVTVFEYGFSAYELPFMVMSLLEGDDLFRTLARGPIEEMRAIRLIKGALEGLATQHSQGIIHKDLKPQNLFLFHPDEADERLIVMDFGAARDLSEEIMTKLHSLTGTPQYLPPEYIRGQLVTPALDVYQMGLVLVEMITGEAIVQDDNVYGALMMHCRGIEIPERFQGGMLEKVLARALAFDHTERFEDAGVFARALDALIAPSVEVLTTQVEAPMRIDRASIKQMLRGSGARVLIVDDDPNMLDMLGFILHEVDVTVIEASNGVEGLHKAFVHQPDLMLLDQHMPGTDGFELLRKLKQNVSTREIPVIMVTAETGLASRVEGLRLGADDYLTKPVESTELIARVGALLEKSARRRQGNEDALTGLPNSTVVDRAIDQRLEGRKAFSCAFAYLRNFDDHVIATGFDESSNHLRRFGERFRACLQAVGGPEDLICHVGGGRFVFLLSTPRAESLCHSLLVTFAEMVPKVYTAETMERGFVKLPGQSFWGKKKAPLMQLHIALVHARPGQFDGRGPLIQKALQSLEQLEGTVAPSLVVS